MSPLSREAIFTLLSGLTLVACDKTQVSAELPGGAAPSASKVAQTTPGAATSASVSAKEIAPPKAAASAAGTEKSCSPGGCGAGSCGANKK